jgi:hypothetical protein
MSIKIINAEQICHLSKFKEMQHISPHKPQKKKTKRINLMIAIIAFPAYKCPTPKGKKNSKKKAVSLDFCA